MRTLLFVAISIAVYFTPVFSARSENAVGNHNTEDALKFNMSIFDQYEPSSGDRDKAVSGLGISDEFQVSIGYQFGTDTTYLSDIKSNRLDSRIRWETQWDDNKYVKEDGKIILRIKDDQQLTSDQDYEIDIQINELSLQRYFESFSVKAGYQKITWGEMDLASITDILTPINFTEFAFTTSDEARISQVITTLEWFTGESSVQFILNLSPSVNEYGSGEIENPVITYVGNSDVVISEIEPEFGSDYEIAFRYKKNIGPSDLAVYLAKIIQNEPNFKNTPETNNFIINYPVLNLIAFSGNYAKEQYLWKTEIGYFEGNNREEYETAIGIDYNSSDNSILTFEIYSNYIVSVNNQQENIARNMMEFFLQYSKNFLNDNLTSSFYINHNPDFKDFTYSALLKYQVNDYLSVELNATVFDIHSTNSPNRQLDKWDIITARVNYDF